MCRSNAYYRGNVKLNTYFCFVFEIDLSLYRSAYSQVKFER